MKFGKDIQDRLLKEVKEFPSIRYAAKKVGLHHSTVYRWMLSHQVFRSLIFSALEEGRQTTNDVARGVIMQAIHSGSYEASKYWLSHHEPQFMSDDKIKAHIMAMYMETEKMHVPKKVRVDDFETLFTMYDDCRRGFGDKAREVMDILLRQVCDNNEELMEVFYNAYEARGDKMGQVKDISKEMEKYMSP